MAAKLAPQPAIASLCRADWQYRRRLPQIHHDGHLMVSPKGEERRVQFRGRNQSTSDTGQYLFGIYYRDFSAVHDMVLWAHGEPVLLVLPTSYLRERFDREIAKIDEYNRWHVNVYFERYGNAELVPVFYGTTYTVNEFALAHEPDR